MLKINKSLVFLLIALMAIFSKSFGQHAGKRQLESIAVTYIFDKDSLEGFDEAAAQRAAISEQFVGPELPVRMFRMKRSFINDKYALWPKFTPAPYAPDVVDRSSVVPGCTNEDFEAATSGTIGSNNAISGWVLSSGVNSITVGTETVNSCNLLGCCNSITHESAIRTTPFVDPIIGTQYPIYSVFGTSTTNSTVAGAANPQLTVPLFGDKVIRINDSINDYSIEKLSKTFAVTGQNALFQFAFISVFATGHNCCDAGSFRIRLYNASNGNAFITCPTFSVAAPGIDCATDANTPNYLEAAASNPPSTTGGGTFTPNSAYIYNPWQISSIDLTQYIGSNITIEILLTDCTGGGHYGYCYFDAQCGPMTIYGNGTPFAAGNSTATVPTCGASGATICAVSGLGPYSWAGPGVGPPYTTPAMSNQCFTTNLSGTFTLYMNPAGACAPITRVISSTVTPAPLLFASAIQATCGSLQAAVTITPAGSAASPSQITYSPAPTSIGGASLSAVYPIPTGTNPAYTVTVTARDPLGCYVTSTAQIKTAPPFPTFTITNVTGSPSITCAHSLIELLAVTNYTYGPLTYTWTSQNTYSVTDDIGANAAGTFTVIGQDTVSKCTVSHTYALGVNLTPPTLSLSPANQNVSCTSPASIVTATTNLTQNLTHYFINPDGVIATSNNPNAIYLPGGKGIFRDSLVNDLNGCSVVKQFSLTSNDVFPSIGVSSAENFTVGCGQGYNVAHVTISNTGTTGATYTVLTGSGPYVSPTLTYSFTAAGNYTAVGQDVNNGCKTQIPFSIISNTAPPHVSLSTDPTPSVILTCANPTAMIVGVAAEPHVAYTWSWPGSGVPQSVNSASVNVTTVPATPSVVALAIYSLVVENLDNGCLSSPTVALLQNLFPPVVVITGNTPITCAQQTINLNTASHSGVQTGHGFSTVGPVGVVEWQGPQPQAPGYFVTYTAAVTGAPYTLTVIDQSNGCTNSGTVVLVDNRIYPIAASYSITPPSGPGASSVAVQLQPNQPIALSCGSVVTTLSVAPTNFTNTTGFRAVWSPAGTNSVGFSHPVNTPGEYIVVLTNTLTGCSTTKEFEVMSGSLTAGFTPDQTSGYAPLTVNFTNNSQTTTGDNNVLTVWSFGNGSSSQTTVNIGQTTTYTQPGTYTVTIHASKGAACQDTASRIISVDIPSVMEIPNVFTPNGDNVNDIFFLKSSNLTDIHILVFDRWGHKVYELASSTGNIAWDGKNDSTGKDAAAGVYFYTIKASGKDGQAYDKKGTITLVR